MPISETTESRSNSTAAGTAAQIPAWLSLVAEKVGTLEYGVVQIVVHDSQVVQVERTERHRFEVSRRA